MSDSKTAENIEKILVKLRGVTNHPFFRFSKPYLDLIGKGKIFGFVYIIMAVVSLILPIAVIVMAANSGLFQYGGAKYVIAFIFSWLVIVFACWIGFQLWLDRRSRIKTIEESEFIATPILSEIMQTFGEWAGTLLGIIGAGVGLIASIILGEEVTFLFEAIGLDFMNFGALVIIIGPLIGAFLMIIFRFIAEQLRIAASLANNTKEIAVSLKEISNKETLMER
jgi:hypothetical protein